MRVATAGSVDDGKSTLIGRLLVDAKQVLEDQLASVRRPAAERDGHGELNLAHLTDGLRAEREQGITIDVAYRYFATTERRFVLADSPGHVEYTRNMVTAASRADAAVVLVDVCNGLLEQSRRHLAISALLCVPHVVVAVNKMDLVGYARHAFAPLEAEVRALAQRLGIAATTVVPVSALHGDNVVERSARTPWYDGPAVLEVLEQVPAEGPGAGGARLPVQLVIEHDGYRAYAGLLERGVLRPGDDVAIVPGDRRARIEGIDVLGAQLDEAVAPRSIAVRLVDGARAGRGDVIATAGDPPAVGARVVATLCWLADAPLHAGERYVVRSGTAETRGAVDELLARLDVGTLERHDAPAAFAANDLGVVRLALDDPLALDRYGDSRYTGSLILIDERTNRTVGAGMVRQVS